MVCSKNNGRISTFSATDISDLGLMKKRTPSPMLLTALRLDDMGWAEAKKTPKRRVSLKRNLRNWFFERLGQ